MSKNLFITTTEAKSGKSAIALGIMQLLLRDIRKVAFFRPIINAPVNGGKDHDINLILSHFNLDEPYEASYAYTLHEAREIINKGQHELLLENILKKYKKLEEKYDFVLCMGTDFLGSDNAFEFDINAEIAANLGSVMLIVANGRGKTADDVIGSTQLAIDALEEKGVDIVAAIVNKANVEDRDLIVKSLRCEYSCSKPLTTYVIPDEKILGQPTIGDVKTWLGADVLYGHGGMNTLVEDYLIAAMQPSNFLDYLTEGSLVITPGDRTDIILTCLASRLSSAYPNIAGMLLTGGLQPKANIHKLIEGWTGVPIPILSVEGHTYKTTQVLNSLYGKIDPADVQRVSSALGIFEANVNIDELRQRLVSTKSTKITPKMFEYSLIEMAAADRQRIVLPEATEDRILQAADILLRRSVVDIVLLGKEDDIKARAAALGLNLSAAEIIDPVHSEHFEDYAATYAEARKKKGVTLEAARDRMADITYFATMMVHKGHADGMVSGAINTTAATIRPAFEFVKTKPGASIVSSCFLMCLKDRVHVYADCAVNPTPNAQQLAEIALGSAETAKIFGIEPRVAMLSYSTGTSGSGEEVDKVREATGIVKERAPEMLVEGPLQYDAAVDMDVAKTKLPDSKVAGRATVFIFPDLNTGNNTYKAVQRNAGAVAIGPVLQGLNKPVNDLSRGCTVPDIVNTVAITAIQAQKK